MRLRYDTRIRRIDAVDVGVDIAAVGADGCGNRNGGGVRPAAPERGDAARIPVYALEAGDNRDLLLLLETLFQLCPVPLQDPGGDMRIVGQDWQLPALPRTRIDAHPFEDDC